MADPSVTLFGPLDAVLGPGDRMEYVLLALTVASFLTRKAANDRHRRQAAEGGADAVERYWLHSFTMGGLLVASFYYLTLHHHAGMVATTLVLGLFLADFFEFEARKVEAREDRPIERPKGALAASVLVLSYVAYQSLFFLVDDIWFSIV